MAFCKMILYCHWSLNPMRRYACCAIRDKALTAFNAKFPGINTTGANYEIVFANFFNHRFGYSLTYDEYRTYLDSCQAHTQYPVTLCNKPATAEATVDNNYGCMADLFATALTNANNTYIAYIESVRRDFREAHSTRMFECAAKAYHDG